MKKSLSLLLLAALFACSSSKLKQDVTLEKTETYQWDRSIVDVPTGPAKEQSAEMEADASNTGFTNAFKIKFLMEFLASDDLEGRDTGSEGIEKAAKLIEDSFASNGIQPYFRTYKDTLSNIDVPAYNVVGYLEGRDPALKDEFVIIGAHYDHIGKVEGENGDTIANGANDNATGTATVMELARYFGASRSNKRSVIFALFSAEEKGLLGSKHLAEKLSNEDLDLYVMLNFEMVGVPMVGKDHLLYVTGYQLSNLADISNRYANDTFAGFLPKAQEFNLFKRSDNFPFHEAFNVPSQTYSTFDFTNYGHYHKVGDETSEMNYEHMAKVVNESIPVMKGIINAPTKEIFYY
ncbi:M20/M25/M40 family metallo-hydrolase [Flavobacteriaceae bacterium TP-CH-4]|uniref:M20/M25/M40 family metallo-hydrolase n=1 Tax=Pelagihabitans pacificus TaxID=2696054 RepID=A0A967E7T9_9FLAO|nr:M20/M25/M40 family metallo-hydrolase [Pelagihabitans pacificus]NHF60975.1 M20/M25/M40 family metallo-hydrolase [Pelagihabitans pacificus]